jgi:hypothetical protein
MSVAYDVDLVCIGGGSAGRRWSRSGGTWAGSASTPDRPRGRGGRDPHTLAIETDGSRREAAAIFTMAKNW